MKELSNVVSLLTYNGMQGNTIFSLIKIYTGYGRIKMISKNGQCTLFNKQSTRRESSLNISKIRFEHVEWC